MVAVLGHSWALVALLYGGSSRAFVDIRSPLSWLVLGHSWALNLNSFVMAVLGNLWALKALYRGGSWAFSGILFKALYGGGFPPSSVMAVLGHSWAFNSKP